MRGRRVASFVGSSLLAQLVLQQVQSVTALFGIGERRFKNEGLIDMGALGLEDVNGMVAALGDLDGGQLYVDRSSQGMRQCTLSTKS